MVSIEKSSEYLRVRLARDIQFDAHEAFKYLDVNKDGVVTEKEIKKALWGKRVDATELELKNLMSKLDKDKDGKVSFIELSEELKPRNSYA